MLNLASKRQEDYVKKDFGAICKPPPHQVVSLLQIKQRGGDVFLWGPVLAQEGCAHPVQDNTSFLCSFANDQVNGNQDF